MQTRPFTFANRPSHTSTTPCQSSIPGRPSHIHSHSRNNSHSVVTGPAHNASHRVTRRKSMSTAANREAVVAILKADGSLPINTVALRGRAVSKSSRSGSPLDSLPAAQASKSSPEIKADLSVTSAIDDEQLSADEASNAIRTARIRRASDGQPLTKEGRKTRPELRCQQCGKGYKHSSCLTKHLWEHTPQWSYTSKLLISKHQQVQLLEAASVLVAMNNRPDDATTPPESAKDFNNSDRESASPAASGYSDHRGGLSSADTTPPPQSEVFGSTSRSAWNVSKRHSSGSGLTQSLQAAKTATNVAASAPNGSSGFGHFRQVSHNQRPPSSGMNKTGRDDRDLAATLEMLSCSVGSNPSRSVEVPSDAPPVPPLPAQFLGQVGLGTSFMTMGSFPTQPESFARGEHPVEDIKMEESSESIVDDDDFDLRSRARSDEDDDGIFGRMEE
ncbi:hypothetical protein MKZ38_010348 [Zalerion maritima]|uniref:C2H2-type domain-containing protein n=1 Tax=Zalerion maritima TaxID=339359 RepID=A0AAD5WVU8_9PEZI|nr:hypothetical protein MKZ38_010348 [Zalerion maritima]